MTNTIKRAALGVGAAAMAATGFAATATTAEAKSKRPTGEERLAKMLKGREAGEPRQCINMSPSRNLQIIDGTALVYKSGKTIWVSKPRNADSLDDDDVLVIRRNGSQLCRLDLITTFDRLSGFYTGNVQLGEFVPYRKP